MTQMGAAAFKARCLQVMEQVRQTRRPVTITKRGVPVVKVVPADPPKKFAGGPRGPVDQPRGHRFVATLRPGVEENRAGAEGTSG